MTTCPAGATRKPAAAGGGRFDAVTFVGAGHAIRRAAWQDAGGYDEALFFCWEEYDFCLRAITRGWRIRYCGDLVVHHKASRARRVTWSGRRWFHFVRNRLYIERKYGGSRGRRPVAIRRLCGEGPAQRHAVADDARPAGSDPTCRATRGACPAVAHGPGVSAAQMTRTTAAPCCAGCATRCSRGCPPRAEAGSGRLSPARFDADRFPTCRLWGVMGAGSEFWRSHHQGHKIHTEFPEA